jgi:hypothetical protein
MTPCIGPYSPVAAISEVRSERVRPTDHVARCGLVRDLGRRPSSGLPFPHRLTVAPPRTREFGTQDGTQKALTLRVGRPSVFGGDRPRSR